MNFSEWFEIRLEQLDIKPAHIVKMSNGVIKANTMSNWLNGIGKPSFEILPALSEVLDCSADDIVNLRPVRQKQGQLSKILKVPYYEHIEFASGDGHVPFCEENATFIEVLEDDIREIGADPKQIVFVKNVGKSNLGAIDENVPVAIDLSKKEIRDGHAYAVRHGELLRIKFLIQMPDGSVKLKSYNKEYEDDLVTKEEIENGFFEVYGWAGSWKKTQNWG